eukprot:TRINITY_DN1539_c0_g1_i2.p1 TRINITY_DN1539_c0_g1~~TRINITY_DN1539_c0_g1_i2.p1  ORF type:complete len:127 (+),score=29.79 TRINITY_DN1539_c0_g1_i2:436-816(+)
MNEVSSVLGGSREEKKQARDKLNEARNEELKQFKEERNLKKRQQELKFKVINKMADERNAKLSAEASVSLQQSMGGEQRGVIDQYTHKKEKLLRIHPDSKQASRLRSPEEQMARKRHHQDDDDDLI